MAKRQSEEVGLDLKELAPDSWEKCPCCSARAAVSHVEPMSGGGRHRHLHRCRRCRHEWSAEPASWLVCPLPLCDAHGLDATGLGGHKLQVQSALVGEMDDGKASDLLRREAGLKAAICSDEELLRIIRALWSGLGRDIGTAVKWLHNPNTAFRAAPASLLEAPYGASEILSYLAARRFTV